MTRVPFNSTIRFASLAALVCCWARTVPAATIPIDTSTAAWTVSGGGATDAAPFVIGTGISISSNTLQTGTFVSGGSAANFDGFWTASLSFFLPADATNVILNFSNLQADDRTVLELNGTTIGSAGIFGPGTGQMVFTEGGPLVDNVTFAATGSSGSTNSGFMLGANNTLLAIVNDTGSGISGPLNDSHSFQTAFAVNGSISFDTRTSAVPEPNNVAFSIFAGSALLWAGRKLRRRA